MSRLQTQDSKQYYYLIIIALKIDFFNPLDPGGMTMIMLTLITVIAIICVKGMII